MLARLLLEPANLLVLDEPTNDLDIGTLAVLEQALAKYDGTVIVVSHDRAFMDRVASRVLAFEGNGEIIPIEGGYSDYLAWKTRRAEKTASEQQLEKTQRIVATPPKAEKKPTKLSYKEQSELEKLPIEIEAMEDEKAAIEARFCDVDYFTTNAEAFQQDQQRLHELETSLEVSYNRWETIEAKQEGLSA